MRSAPKQGMLWGAAAADWAELTEPAMLPAYDAAFDAIGVGPGTRLLDAGCGAGLAMMRAQARGATVCGFDASEGLIAVARGRMPSVEFGQGDLEELPYADDSFDAVTAFNSVQYASDPVAALRELGRVTVPGGPIVVMSWAEPERCETRAVLAAIGRLLPPPPAGAGGPFALSAPGKLEALVEAAGLTPQSAHTVDVAFCQPDLESAIRANLASGPAQLAIEQAGQAATRDAVGEALAASVQPDGSSRQDNAFRFVIATASSPRVG
jgi:SAM-dependent methyltransferase